MRADPERPILDGLEPFGVPRVRPAQLAPRPATPAKVDAPRLVEPEAAKVEAPKLEAPRLEPPALPELQDEDRDDGWKDSQDEAPAAKTYRF